MSYLDFFTGYEEKVKKIIRRVSYLARQDGAWNGAFADVEIYVSNSPEIFNTKPDIVSKLKKDKKPQSIDFGKSITKQNYVLTNRI